MAKDVVSDDDFEDAIIEIATEIANTQATTSSNTSLSHKSDDVNQSGQDLKQTRTLSKNNIRQILETLQEIPMGPGKNRDLLQRNPYKNEDVSPKEELGDLSLLTLEDLFEDPKPKGALPLDIEQKDCLSLKDNDLTSNIRQFPLIGSNNTVIKNLSLLTLDDLFEDPKPK